MNTTPKFLGVIDEEPFDPSTWSGSSRYFFSALQAQGLLGDAVSAMPAKATQFSLKIRALQPSMEKWRFKYHLSLGLRKAMTSAALRNIQQVDRNKWTTLLQVGAWYDLSAIQCETVSYHDGNLACRLSSPYGYPSISSNHISSALAYERQVYERIALIFPMSRWLARSFEKDFGVPTRKLFPVGAGINLPRIREVGTREFQPKLLMVGKDFKRKGGHILLEAFGKARRELRNLTLTVVGPEPPPSVPDGVVFKGFIDKSTESGVDALLNEYAEATAYVLPSLYEPFGISLAEAMAHRLPCIGTRNCAIPEIIDENQNGLLVPPGDSTALAAAIVKMFEDELHYRRMADAAFSKYESTYTWDIVARKISDTVRSELQHQ